MAGFSRFTSVTTAIDHQYKILFPGQGTQYVGMTKTLSHRLPPSIDAVFRTADSVFGFDIRKMCLEGPQGALNQTIHCQPAVVVTSLAAYEAIKLENPLMVRRSVAMAGFSVGELTALIASSAISLEEGLKLVKLRSEAMQGSCLEVPSGMLTVIGLDQDRLDDCCRRVNTDSDPISISIHLFPSGFAVAGTLKALALLKDVVINEGASNVKDVLVSGGFHSKLMDSAVLKFKKAVESTHISFPEIPVYSNVTGNVYTNVDEIRELLPLQLVRPVLWNESMCGMINKFGEEHFSEIGPGKSLKLILRRINKNAFATCINYEI